MTILHWRREFIVNSQKTAFQRTPSVTALDDGGFAIAWRDDGVAGDLVR
jgi:hypothetical protein